MITEKKILKDYSFIKSKAYYYEGKGDIEKTLRCIESGALLAYQFNLFFADDDYEKILNKIAERFKVESPCQLGKDRFIFYDYFGLDNRGLTQQYIRALMSWNVDFMYILIDNNDIKESSDILKELKNYSKCTVKIIGAFKKKRVEVVTELVSVVRAYKASNLLFHSSPWDVSGCVMLNVFTELDKYLINLTDHAFWLGKESCNYFIEFRNYGFNISVNHRGISREKLLIQPYYPIYTKYKFKGFPIDYKNKVVLFTGGSFYKMYGKKGEFFKILKRVLCENSKTILLVAGGGVTKPFEEFVEDNNLNERVVFIGNRKDIFEVFKNIDIYIGTYPLSGALMSQFAALNNKNIISYTSKELLCNMLNEIVDVNNPIENKITFTEKEEFHKEINRLINDEKYREKKSLSLDNSIISPSEFNNQLKQLLGKKVNINYKPIQYTIKTKELANVYLEAENNYLKCYDSNIYHFFRTVGDVFIPLNMWVHLFKYVFKRIKESLRI